MVHACTEAVVVVFFCLAVPVVAQPSQIHVDASQTDPGSFLGERLRAQLVRQRSPNRMQERVPPRLLTRRTRRPNEQFGMRQPINVNDHPQTHLASTVHRTFPRRQPLRRTFQNGMVPYPGQTSGSQRSSQHMYPEFPTLERPLAPRVMYPNRMNLGPPGRYFAPTRPFVSSVTATRRCEGLLQNGTCHFYMHVMDGGCHGKSYTWEHCPRFFMCCYTIGATNTLTLTVRGKKKTDISQVNTPSTTSSDPMAGPVIETTTVTPTATSPRTVASAECAHNGTTYTPGDIFPDVDGCNNCQCTILGGVLCTYNIC